MPVWIGAAMVAGPLLGRAIPGWTRPCLSVEVGSVSLPIAVKPLLAAGTFASGTATSGGQAEGGESWAIARLAARRL